MPRFWLGGFDTFHVRLLPENFETITVTLPQEANEKLLPFLELRSSREEESATVRCATHSFTEAKTLPWLETVTLRFMRQKNWPQWQVLLPSIPMAKNQNFPESRLLQ